MNTILLLRTVQEINQTNILFLFKKGRKVLYIWYINYLLFYFNFIRQTK